MSKRAKVVKIELDKLTTHKNSGRVLVWAPVHHTQSLHVSRLWGRRPVYILHGLLTESTCGLLSDGFLEPQEHTLGWGTGWHCGGSESPQELQPISEGNVCIKDLAPSPLSGTTQKRVLYPVPEASNGTEPQLPLEAGCSFTIPLYWLLSPSYVTFLIPYSIKYCLGSSSKESLLF